MCYVNHMVKKNIGKIGEDAVCNKLICEGYVILVRNYSVHNVGELDIVATKGPDVYVVEVKARSSRNSDYGTPESFITRSKMGKMRRTIGHLLNDYELYGKNVTILAGSVLHDGKGNVISVELIEI